MIGLSKRAKSCKASATLAITAEADRLKAEGKDVIGFGAGQPDFQPPKAIRKAAIDAINAEGTAKYTPASGLPALKKAVVKKFRKDNGLEYTTKDISINVGAKHTIYNILQTIINEGDEVIIPRPYWVSYPEMVSLAGGKSVYVKTDDEFKLHASAIRSAITKKTKAVIINSPSNPSGAVIEKEELQKIANLAIKHQFYIISDEIYEKIIYDAKHVSIASFSDAIKAITFTVNGMSKSHAIPGWRIGYVAGPKDAIASLNNIQSHSTSNPCSIVQYAAASTLNSEDSFIKEAREEFRKRRDYIVSAINKIPSLVCPLPGGAFYVFVKIGTKDDFDFAEKLLSEKYVAVVPGTEFGMPGYIRLSYATSMENIKKGVKRIKEFIE
jgi:aspartate aminotransferase